MLGDAIHKGTPNAGQGGNNGIGSAAALANALYQLAQQGGKPTRDQVIFALDGYQSKRRVRANGYLDSAKLLTHLQALYSLPHRVATWYAADMWESSTVDLFSDQCQKAPKIDFLPVPAKSLQGWMPFNEEQGAGMKESIAWRLGLATLIVLVAFGTQGSFRSQLRETPTGFEQIDADLSFAVVHLIMLLGWTRRLANSWTCAAM